MTKRVSCWTILLVLPLVVACGEMEDGHVSREAASIGKEGAVVDDVGLGDDDVAGGKKQPNKQPSKQLGKQPGCIHKCDKLCVANLLTFGVSKKDALAKCCACSNCSKEDGTVPSKGTPLASKGKVPTKASSSDCIYKCDKLCVVDLMAYGVSEKDARAKCCASSNCSKEEGTAPSKGTPLASKGKVPTKASSSDCIYKCDKLCIVDLMAYGVSEKDARGKCCASSNCSKEESTTPSKSAAPTLKK